MSSIAALAATLRSSAKPGMKPKELLSVVRGKHPESSKKEIVRAAFYALAEGDVPPEDAARLHGFALGERSTDEDAPIKRSKLRKKRGKTMREAPVG